MMQGKLKGPGMGVFLLIFFFSSSLSRACEICILDIIFIKCSSHLRKMMYGGDLDSNTSHFSVWVALIYSDKSFHISDSH